MVRPDHPNDWGDLVRGCEAFHDGEPRDVFYRTSTYILDRCWREPSSADLNVTAEAIGVLLIPWNPQYYRGHSPNYAALSEVLEHHAALLRGFSGRSLASFDPHADGSVIDLLFTSLLEPLSYRTKGRNELRRAHVPTVKALHLLAPNFFPLWDGNIASGYDCHWESPTESPRAYLRFMELVKGEIDLLGRWKEVDLRARSIPGHDTGGILKVHDEWNYSHFTGGWV